MPYMVIGDTNPDNTETWTITRNEISTTGGKTKEDTTTTATKTAKFKNLKKSNYNSRSDNQDTFKIVHTRQVK